MPRHISQISFSQCVDDAAIYKTIIALSTDNTLWETSWDDRTAKWRPWTQIPNIPTTRENPPK